MRAGLQLEFDDAPAGTPADPARPGDGLGRDLPARGAPPPLPRPGLPRRPACATPWPAWRRSTSAPWSMSSAGGRSSGRRCSTRRRPDRAGASSIGARYVQVLSGPVQPGGPYRGPAGLSRAERREVTGVGAAFRRRTWAPLTGSGTTSSRSPGRPLALAGRRRRGGRGSRARQRRPGPRLLAPVAGRHDRRPDSPGSIPRIIYGVDFADSLGPAGLARCQPGQPPGLARRGPDPAARVGRGDPLDRLRRLVGQ